MTKTAPEPLLRTLAPALKELERLLLAWLGAKRRFPLSTLQRGRLEGLTQDLGRQAEALQAEQPVLVIVLMGGTGVGKSTLLNALAGGAIAQASFQRPTTRDPVVYYHHSTQPHRLDPALQHCRLVSHDRPSLEGKVLVDTPDLDSNDVSNREKLLRIIPVADIVLYVGSQEKYHDRLGWELFTKERRRRGFAFILNKWDRCYVPEAGGVRPDEDLLRGLAKEGFASPLLFRTCAQHWVDHPLTEANGKPPVEGEQFADLVRWLNEGLTRLEIEAIKARGVSRLLAELDRSLRDIAPPDLTEPAQRVRDTWKKLLDEEAQAHAVLLLATLEPYQREIEHHFAMERQHKFRGIMASYLHLFNRMRYSGSTLRDQLPFVGRSGGSAVPANWDLAAFTQAAASATSEQHLEARQRALANRLLIEADANGFPLALLQEATEETARLDWRSRLSTAVTEVLGQIEHSWSQPRGVRRWLQTTLVILADWLPILACGFMAVLLIWQYTMDQRAFAWGDLLLPALVMVMVMVALHVVTSILMPLGWQALRGKFETALRDRLRSDLETAFNTLPGTITQDLLKERRQVEKIQGDTREVAGWLERHETAAGAERLFADEARSNRV